MVGYSSTLDRAGDAVGLSAELLQLRRVRSSLHPFDHPFASNTTIDSVVWLTRYRQSLETLDDPGLTQEGAEENLAPWCFRPCPHLLLMRSCCYTSGSSGITLRRQRQILQTQTGRHQGRRTIYSGRTTTGMVSRAASISTPTRQRLSQTLL